MNIYTSLFKSEAEVCIYSDLTNKEPNINMYDTMYLVNLILEKPTSLLPWHTRTNRINLLKAVYKHAYELCDWKQLNVQSPKIYLIKKVLGRIENSLAITKVVPDWLLYVYIKIKGTK